MTRDREQIIVTIAPDGSVGAETRGIKGSGCLDYINLLEDLLEAEVSSSSFTSEYTEIQQSAPNEEIHDIQQR